MKVIIDNGHGRQTPGKCSPDHQLREYAYTRDLARRLSAALAEVDIDSVRLVPEDDDTPLRERVRRANAIYQHDRSAVLLSLHLNAAGADGQWHTASGFSVFVAPNASEASRRLARLVYDAAERRSLRGNRAVPEQRYWVQSLAVCRDTKCPAILSECLFQDNRDDVRYLLAEAGRDALVALHVEAIRQYYRV